MPPPENRHFSTTRWSAVLAVSGVDREARDVALRSLCEIYWRPVYAFIRRSGRTPDEAADLTQSFFVRVLENDFFAAARPHRGRFRSFLLTSVRHFLANAYEQQQAAKRGGGHIHLSLVFDAGEREYALEPADRLTPERLYERQWALTLLSHAIERVAAEYEASHRGPLFAALRPFITGDLQEPPYAELASALQMSPGALRVAVHRLRQHCGRALRAVIADTVDDAAEVNAELEYLLKVLADPG